MKSKAEILIRKLFFYNLIPDRKFFEVFRASHFVMTGYFIKSGVLTDVSIKITVC
jgi:hypothetical protein